MWIRTLLCSLLLLFTGSPNAIAKSYEIPTIQVEVAVNPDGTIRITEHLTYQFDGSFSWAEYTLPMQGFSAIQDITITGPQGAYINENSEQTGTFRVANDEENIRLRWYFNAEDEQRTFTVSYTLEGAVTIGAEWSEFFWNYVSDEQDKSTDRLIISIDLPQPVSADSLYGWTRGPDGQIELQTSDGAYSVMASNIHDDEFVKVRTVFPTRIFDESVVKVSDADFSLAWAQQEEQALQRRRARQAERQAYYRDIGQQIGLIILALSLGIFYLIYHKYGKRHSTSRFSDSKTIMIPSQLKPAAIGWLLSGRSITGGQIMATVLDLARRGYFKIEEQPPAEGWFEDGKSAFSIEQTGKELETDLEVWERELIHFLEEQLSEGTSNLQKMFNNSSDLSNWISGWKKSLKEYCFEKGWIDLESFYGAYMNGGLQIVLFFLTIALLILGGQLGIPILILSLFVTLISAILSFTIIRRSESGEAIYHSWKNYKEGLQNAKEYEISSDHLDRHFIYAVAMGIGKKDIEDLFTSAGEFPVFAWIAISGQHSPAQLASRFSTLGASGTATFSGTSGGAGATAGAAGGGASASAG
ncbi:MAG: DUF2207 domain-containing protein [Balneolaceae bacterium]|nr:DUF2207 domain-containing protein [Balneolaceae bacterium]